MDASSSTPGMGDREVFDKQNIAAAQKVANQLGLDLVLARRATMVDPSFTAFWS